jgi:selenocysteine lyase/cysteine desulfurase
MFGQRHLIFPGLEASSYWSFAAISPLSEPARRAIEGWHRVLATRGVMGFGEVVHARDQLRGELAGLLGGDASDYALTSGTTHGVVALARSIAWRAGEGIVLLSGEFPTNVIPWEQAARDFDLRVEKVPADAFRDVDAAISRVSSILKNGGIRVVACSAVEFQTGLALPLEVLAEVCHRYGAMLVVDAIQAAGVVPLDLQAMGVDLAVGGGHKWLLGVDGVGWVYASERGKAALGSAMGGWLSVEDGVRFLFESDALEVERAWLRQPRVLESGSTSSAAVVALREGVRMCVEAGPARTLAWVQGLHDGVEARIEALGFISERAAERRLRSGILSFQPPGGVELRALQGALSRRSVAITIPDGRLRLAPHFCSTAEEGEVLVAALTECLEEARGLARYSAC